MKSKGEAQIEQILKTNNIKYEKEKCFADLRGGRYRFDFFLPNKNICIEVDGEQHFHRVQLFHKTKVSFERQKAHDRQKNSYCLAHNIHLYRLPYWVLKDITTFNDIFKNQFLVKDRWHNDKLIESLRGGER